MALRTKQIGKYPDVDHVVMTINHVATSSDDHIDNGRGEPICQMQHYDHEWHTKSLKVYPPSHVTWCEQCLDTWMKTEDEWIEK